MPTATEQRLIAYHIARLKDKNPQVRLASIEELRLLEATDALSALEELFHSDPDDEVRTAARKVGYDLYVKMKANEKKEEPPPE
ncbi:MAG: HEAT repeat domain-containing protein [Chloroflexi bacterium]|nr:HEAT repeat domain-containing protein [Chloroflexota bacterium]